jgi:hypothetical protein
MKPNHYTIVAAVVVTLFSSAGFAASGPETIDLSASMGKVTFPHKQHQEMLQSCTKCHIESPGKIAEMGKEWAHTTCKGCHTRSKQGPTSCRECHKK